MNNYDGRDGQMFVMVALVLIVVFVVPAVYAMYAGKINSPLLAFARLELWPETLWSGEATIARDRLAQIDPAELDWSQIERILDYAGRWLRWPCLGILLFAFIMVCKRGIVANMTQKYSMEKLLEHNAKNFPCLKPIVGKGKYLLSPESYDKGLWKIARTPVQFALQNGILRAPNGQSFCLDDALVNGLPSVEKPAFGKCGFNEDEARSALKRQLGAVYSGFDMLSPARKTIGCAFMLYGTGRKKDCITLLDEVSNSYSEKDGKPDCPVFGKEDFLKKLAEMKDHFEEFCRRSHIQKHLAFQLPLFMALLTEARKKGVLACSQFLWLRPVDRPLWYTLSQCGGRTAWAESLAAWSHYQAEELEGNMLLEPNIEAGVASLSKSLEAQGWFLDVYVPTAGANVDKDGTVSAPAEDNDEE